jgi:MoaA/NifB/PqqE/SkfB family radical SAM enzyme
MIEKILGTFQRGRKRRAFATWQVELTTRCPLQCKMCIRRERTDWQHQDMPLEDFRKLLPYLHDVETLVLEGWGESLLYGDLAECIRLAKREGVRVGFVTSGMGLTPNRACELLEAGLDFVGFSIAGTTRETHDAIRVNSRLPDVLAAIRLFQEEKKRRGLSRPAMHLVFLMLKDNIHEVPQVPALAKEAGIEEIILTNICHAINPWQESQRVFLWEKAANPYEAVLTRATENAQRLHVRLTRPSLSAGDVSVCAENPFASLYISADGAVSPCVYLYPPLPSPFKRIFCEKEYSTEKVAFGNVFREPFPTIWSRSDYEAFRNRFRERDKAYRDLYLSLWDGPRLRTAPASLLPDPPAPCRTCHKILGI